MPAWAPHQSTAHAARPRATAAVRERRGRRGDGGRRVREQTGAGGRFRPQAVLAPLVRHGRVRWVSEGRRAVGAAVAQARMHTPGQDRVAAQTRQLMLQPAACTPSGPCYPHLKIPPVVAPLRPALPPPHPTPPTMAHCARRPTSLPLPGRAVCSRVLATSMGSTAAHIWGRERNSETGRFKWLVRLFWVVRRGPGPENGKHLPG